MKLLVIMTIEEHAAALKQLLARAGVPVFSEMEMKGYKPGLIPDERENWFVHDDQSVYSHLIFTIVDDTKTDEVMRVLHEHSEYRRPPNPIHAFQLKVEHFF